MRTYRVINFILMILVVSSCSNDGAKQTSSQSNCYSMAISLMFVVEENFELYIQNESNNDEQGIIRGQLLDSLDFMTRSILTKSGGVVENGQLYDGCRSANDFVNYYDEYLNSSIRPLYDSLNPSDPISKRLIETLNRNIFGSDPYFSKDYFLKSKLFQFANDMFTLELVLMDSDD